MMRANYQVNATAQFRVLSDDQIEEVFHSALDVLERVGTRVYGEEGLALLHHAGCPVRDDLVRIPSWLVKDALNTTPERIALAGRDRHKRIILEKDYLAGEYEPKPCFQCVEPLCLLACPVAVLQVDRQSGTYARIIDERVCIGCQRCVEACGSRFVPARPRYDAGRRVSVKCHLCFGEPQCVAFCPYRALRLEWSDLGLRTGYPVIREP